MLWFERMLPAEEPGLIYSRMLLEMLVRMLPARLAGRELSELCRGGSEWNSRKDLAAEVSCGVCEEERRRLASCSAIQARA